MLIRAYFQIYREFLMDDPIQGEQVTDVYEDMRRLNAMYEEMCWGWGEELEFFADYKNDCIIIKRKLKED